MTRAKDISKILTDADISGNIDVDGVTNLDVVDIDGALTQDGGAVFNEGSADVDFRVESNGNANMLVVDGGNDKVSIGTATQDLTLTVNESLSIRNSNRAAGINVDSNGNVYFGTATTDGNIVFETGHTTTGLPSTGTTKMTVAGSGAVTIANGLTLTDGNLVVASGHGIDFGATGNVSGTSSELLDDYEEGTWTPSSSDAGGAFYSNGKYVKVGGSVFIQANIGNIGGGIDFGALPFVPSVQSGMAFGQIYQVNYPSGAMQLYSHVDTNSKIKFTFSRDTGTPLAATSTDLAHSSCTISISGFYTTTA